MKTEYALRTLQSLNKKTLRTGHEISLEQEIPLPFLEKILASLKDADLVKSHRGRKGGYQLARPKAEISIWDVYCAVETRTEYQGEQREDCFPGLKEKCSRESFCSVKNVWGTINRGIREHLGSITLESI